MPRQISGFFSYFWPTEGYQSLMWKEFEKQNSTWPNLRRNTIFGFFNKVWRNHYPWECHGAEIIPVLKKGKEPNTPANFRTWKDITDYRSTCYR